MSRVAQRIKKSEKKYDAKDQRCELLIRNKIFLEELKGPILGEDPNEGWLFEQGKEKLLNAIKTGSLTNIEENFIIGVLKRNARVELKKLKGKSLKKINDWLQQELKKRPRGFEGIDDPRWRKFCRRWQISILFGNNKLENLRKYVYSNPPIFYRNPKKGKYITFVDLPDIEASSAQNIWSDPWELEVKKEDRFIYLRIDAWTQEKDIEKTLSRLKKLQQEIYGYSGREKRTFGRDLCWWDFHNKEEFGKLSYGSIVNRWKTYKDKKVSREVVRFGVKRIQEYIDRLTALPI